MVIFPIMRYNKKVFPKTRTLFPIMRKVMSKKQPNALEKAKQQHFDFLRKNNAITDAKNGELSLGAMKSLDIILQKYQETQETKMQLELSYLRQKLGLQNNNAYVDRIKTYLLELKLPFELRDFHDAELGKEISWALTSFLNDVKSYKETQHLVEINISQNFINYMVERAGYTNINLSLSKEFKTKYGYKIYEMYLRYYSMPNKIDNSMGVIKKDINGLNDKFGTTHKHASKMIEGINRGILEIKRLLNINIYCTYIKIEKKFIFSWDKSSNMVISPCMIPFKRIDEFTEWIISHTESKIKNITLYKAKIKKLILSNKYDEWEEKYRGMMLYKYGYTSEEIDEYKLPSGHYKDFSKTKTQKVLFKINKTTFNS